MSNSIFPELTIMTLCISSFYCAVFDILNDIIAWFKEKSANRYAKALLQQSSCEKSLEAKVETSRRAVSVLKIEGVHSFLC